MLHLSIFLVLGVLLSDAILDATRARRNTGVATQDVEAYVAALPGAAGGLSCALQAHSQRLIVSSYAPKAAMGHRIVVFVMEMGRTHRQVDSSKRITPSDSRLGLAWRNIQGNDARHLLAKLGPRPPWTRNREGSIQAVCNDHTAAFTPWQSAAQDKEAWDTTKSTLFRSMCAHPETTRQCREDVGGLVGRHHRRL